MQPWCTPFPIWNQSIVPCPSWNCCFFTCIQISQEAGQVLQVRYFGIPYSWRIFQFVWSTQSKPLAQSMKQMFFWNSLAFSMIQRILAIYLISAFPKFSLNIWKFSVHVLLKPGLENFEHYFASVWDECNCVVVWAFFDIAFLWDWNENWPFAVLWPLLSLPNLLAYWVQHFHSIIFQNLK